MDATTTTATTGAVCPTSTITAKSPPFIHDGKVTIQAHQVGWLLCGIFALVSSVASFWLINKHLLNYTNPGCQRYIVRLLFMVPIYSIVTLLAYIFYAHASPFLILRDGYEGVVLYAFFYLMLQYLSPDVSEQKNIIRRKPCFSQPASPPITGRVGKTHGSKGKKDGKEKGGAFHWLFPLGWVKYRPEDGLYFLQLMKWGVLQYCVLRPSGAILSVIMEAAGLYCEDSWSPKWAHIYIVTIVSISVTIAMYCLLQLYVIIAVDLAPHKPLLQLISIKAVVFLTFWQSTFLSGLQDLGVVKDQQYMTADEINVGIAALLQNFEMVIFAFLHMKAFSYLPYRLKPLPPTPGPIPHPFLPNEHLPSSSPNRSSSEGHTPRLAALRHAFSFKETWRELRDGAVYLWTRMRGYEPEPHSRMYHFEAVMGVERPVAKSPVTGAGAGPGGRVRWVEETPDYKTSRARRLSWDATLEPLYPRAQVNIDEELEVAPPASVLRDHIRQLERFDATVPPPLSHTPPHDMVGEGYSTSPTASYSYRSDASPPSSIPRPSQLVMPVPLAPNRLPHFEY